MKCLKIFISWHYVLIKGEYIGIDCIENIGKLSETLDIFLTLIFIEEFIPLFRNFKGIPDILFFCPFERSSMVIDCFGTRRVPFLCCP